MAVVNRRYAPGYTGVALINNADVPIQGWAADHDPGLWDATTPDNLGFIYQEAGLQKITVTCTMLVTVTPTAVAGPPASTTYAPNLPAFAAGMTIPCTFSILGSVAYQGNFIVTKFSTKPDLKGGVQIDLSLDSQGVITGNLVPAGIAATPTTPDPTPSS